MQTLAPTRFTRYQYSSIARFSTVHSYCRALSASYMRTLIPHDPAQRSSPSRAESPKMFLQGRKPNITGGAMSLTIAHPLSHPRSRLRSPFVKRKEPKRRRYHPEFRCKPSSFLCVDLQSIRLILSALTRAAARAGRFRPPSPAGRSPPARGSRSSGSPPAHGCPPPPRWPRSSGCGQPARAVTPTAQITAWLHLLSRLAQ